MEIWINIERIVRLFSNIGLVLACAPIIFMTVLVFLEILGRSFLNLSTQIADEFSGYFLVGLSYFGLGYTFRTEGFLRIQLIKNILKEKTIAIFDIISYVLAIIYTAFLVRYLLEIVYQSYIFKSKAPTFAETPLYVPQCMMVIGAFILLIEIVVGFINYLKKLWSNEKIS